MIKKNENLLVPQCLSNLVPFKNGFTLAEGATHVGVFDNCRRCAFTLAEVLITLGIIGVVAAMTIPTLMVDINSKQWSTAADVFEKKLNEAMKNMNTAQVISGHPNTLSFVNELGKHFKINKICKNNELQNCFPETVYWGAGEATPEEVDMKEITQASHFGLQDWGTELIGVQFANGVAGLVAYNPKCSGDPYSNQFKGTDCISMLYDTSGNKNPNTLGKDLGNYGVINSLGGATCAFEIGGTCYGTPFDVVAITKSECESLKDDLGINYCEYSNDYWAGAVKYCGGVSKLPTKAQLNEIADYVFNSTSHTNLDTDKVISLGFKLYNNDSEFYIWSNEEIDGEWTYDMNCGLSGCGHSTMDRDNIARQGVCIVN